MPRLTSLSGAQVAVLFDDPLGIVEFDEVADGIPQLRDVAVDATMDDLFISLLLLIASRGVQKACGLPDTTLLAE